MKKTKKGLLLTRNDFRRVFAALLLCVFVFGAFTGWGWLFRHHDGDLRIILDDNDSSVSFIEAAQLAIRLNKVNDMIPEDYAPAVWQSDLYDWAREILPMYAIEGATDQVTIPYYLEFYQFWCEMHDKVGGKSDCELIAILNRRYSNDHSSWYRDVGVVATLAHELAHVQQGEEICADVGGKTSEERAIIENTAQIVSWEVLAALTNSGNFEAAFSLVDELFNVALLTARYKAEVADMPWLYEWLLKALEPRTASEQARYDRSKRYWADKGDELQFILRHYYAKPLAMVVDAHRNHGGNVHGLALKPEYLEIQRSGWIQYHPVPRIFVVDDLIYFIDHCKAIMADLVHEYEKTRG